MKLNFLTRYFTSWVFKQYLRRLLEYVGEIKYTSCFSWQNRILFHFLGRSNYIYWVSWQHSLILGFLDKILDVKILNFLVFWHDIRKSGFHGKINCTSWVSWQNFELLRFLGKIDYIPGVLWQNCTFLRFLGRSNLFLVFLGRIISLSVSWEDQIYLLGFLAIHYICSGVSWQDLRLPQFLRKTIVFIARSHTSCVVRQDLRLLEFLGKIMISSWFVWQDVSLLEFLGKIKSTSWVFWQSFKVLRFLGKI